MKKPAVIFYSLCLLLNACKEGEVKKEAAHDSHAVQEKINDELHLSDLQIQLGNIKADSLREKDLGHEFMITGVVTVDQTKATTVASRVMGRIEKLYFKNIGENVRKGDILYEIYSEDLNVAVKELQLAAEKYATLQNDQIDLQSILESSRTRLHLYGLSEYQVTDLEKNKNSGNTIKILSPVSGIITSVDIKEGDYLMEGASILQLADLSSLWVEAQVYSDHLNDVRTGTNAKVTIPGYNNFEYEGSVSFINPELNPTSKINIVRIRMPNTDDQIKPGVQAYISVLTNQIKSVALPTNAIILDGKGAIVWVQTGKNTFKSRMIKTGIESNGYTQVIQGLQKGDKVVVSGAYLINSEYIFRKGVNPMEGHDMGKM